MNEEKIEKMTVLEEFIANNNIDTTSNILEYSKGVGCSYNEILYIIHAILLPKEKFRDALFHYEGLILDKNKENFINELSKKYNTPPQVIIKRLKEVKAIIEYQQAQIQKQTQIKIRKRKK